MCCYCDETDENAGPLVQYFPCCKEKTNEIFYEFKQSIKNAFDTLEGNFEKAVKSKNGKSIHECYNKLDEVLKYLEKLPQIMELEIAGAKTIKIQWSNELNKIFRKTVEKLRIDLRIDFKFNAQRLKKIHFLASNECSLLNDNWKWFNKDFTKEELNRFYCKFYPKEHLVDTLNQIESLIVPYKTFETVCSLIPPNDIDEVHNSLGLIFDIRYIISRISSTAMKTMKVYKQKKNFQKKRTKRKKR